MHTRFASVYDLPNIPHKRCHTHLPLCLHILQLAIDIETPEVALCVHTRLEDMQSILQQIFHSERVQTTASRECERESSKKIAAIRHTGLLQTTLGRCCSDTAMNMENCHLDPLQLLQRKRFTCST